MECSNMHHSIEERICWCPGIGIAQIRYRYLEGPVAHILFALIQFRLTPNDSSHAYQTRLAGFPFQALLSKFLSC